ncbi:MAG TPA: hypothetical protein VMB74_10400 [Streptosporangiaceae bacterium]|nr:hypothetical protein [Streptosporangiaceae bacterium]
MPALRRLVAAATAAAGAIAAVGLAAAPAASARPAGSLPYLSQFQRLKTIASTVPANGDLNPYGVWILRDSIGRLHKGNILVSNFNNKNNLQGTGRTIVQITPRGRRTVFADINPRTLPGACPGGVGLTTALVVLPNGWVVVGSTPSRNGMASTSAAGCLIVLNAWGKVAETISGRGINGPWDATVVITGHFAQLFVTNVLNGTRRANGKVVHRGTVLRITLQLFRSAPPARVKTTVIGSGFPQRTDPNAFILGPTGVGIGQRGVLYVAETLTSRIWQIPRALTRHGSAGQGRLLTKGRFLSMPLGLALAPNSNVLTVNGGNGRIVETTPNGRQIFSRFLDTSGSPPGAGALFGLAVLKGRGGVYYVDDAQNTLRLLH